MSVETVLEARAECADEARAQAALTEALAAARAPRRGPDAPWTLTVRVSRAPGRGTRPMDATAAIADARGTLVAERTVSDRTGKACLPLARAVGAWATLVLDAEMNRAKDEVAAPDAQPPAPESSAARIEGETSTPTLAEAPPTSPSKRTVELGAMMFLRNGVSVSGGVGGVSPYVSIEAGPSWIFRPAVQVGWSTGATPLDAAGNRSATFAHYALRLDLCRRVPGNYIERRGIELDLCAGADEAVLITHDGTARENFAPGPSVNLRGELGAGFALEVRGAVGVNLIRKGFSDEGDVPIASADGEIGVSWRLP